MRKFFSFFVLIAALAMATATTMTSCERIDAGCEGIKVHLYGSDRGVDDVNLVTGWVWFNPFTTKVYEYPTFVQTIDYEPFELQSKDGSKFIVDPTIQMNIMTGKTPDIFKKYRLKLKDIEEGTLVPIIYNAYRIELNKFTADELISNREQFESAVEERLRATLETEYFHVGECTSGLVPPESLVDAINAKNKAVQDQLRVENEVKVAEAEAKKLVVKAEAQAHANRLINSSLTPQVLESKRLDLMQSRWDGKFPHYMGGNMPMLFKQI